MTKHLCSRLCVVLLWITLSLGIYQCSVENTEQQPQQDTEEQVQPVSPMMDDKIRVLIKTGSYENIYHDKIVMKGQRGLYIETKQNLQELSPDEEFTITSNEWKQGSVTIYPKADGRIELPNVGRSEAVSYRGSMTCYIILDAALALDHAGEQIAVDAQHSGHAGQQGNDQVHGNADVGAGERLHPVGRNGVDDGGDHAEHHGAQHAANGSLHGLFGADHGAEFVLAKGSACKVGAGIAAPGKAEDEQNKEHRVIAVGLHRQQLLQTDKGVEAEDHDAGKHHQTAGFCKIHLCVAHHQIDAEEQHHQKGGRHDQPPPHLIAGQHDQQGVGHKHGVHGPFLSAKAQGLEDLVDGDQGDGGNDKIEHQRVKGEQHPDQDEDAHNCGYDTSFHSNFSFWELQGSDAAKPAGALVELRDGGIQVIPGEIRPEHIHLHQFGVGGLPEHEVGKALLARGTQDEIRVLLAGGIHVVAHHLFGDVLGLEGALCHLLGQLPGGPHDLGAAAVVHGNVQGHAGLGGGVLLQLVHQLLELCIQRGPVAQELDADVAVLIVEALELLPIAL